MTSSRYQVTCCGDSAIVSLDKYKSVILMYVFRYKIVILQSYHNTPVITNSLFIDTKFTIT